MQRIAVIGPNADVARYGDYEKESNGVHISIAGMGSAICSLQTTVTFDAGKDIAAAVAKRKMRTWSFLAWESGRASQAKASTGPILILPGNQEHCSRRWSPRASLWSWSWKMAAL